MKREILFRGKRVDNGDGRVTNGEEAVISWYISFHIGSLLGLRQSSCGFFEVILETVGQYTGLKDKKPVSVSIRISPSFAPFLIIKSRGDLFVSR